MAGEKAVQRKDKRIVIENVRRLLLQEYLMKQTQRAGFGGLDIQRTPMGTRVTLIAERPGLVIGRKGSSIKALTDAVERQFNFDNPQIEVQEVGNAALNASLREETDTRPPPRESSGPGEGARAEAAAATEEPTGGAGRGRDVVPPPLERGEPPIAPPAEEKPLETVKTSKVAGKRLKK